MIDIVERCHRMAIAFYKNDKEKAIASRYIKLAIQLTDNNNSYVDYASLSESFEIFLHKNNYLPFVDYSEISENPINLNLF